ncbi:hypothetical protein CCH79_00007847 [Gambusia affinis]|uniref:Uncharacterized protein n=1 Tax=Gambusia affinis TaxID=33528 RepID=A0A315WCF2_GAMAF|nr:hypothetical protein CCH79_00007847 [Gambusia affinis]
MEVLGAETGDLLWVELCGSPNPHAFCHTGGKSVGLVSKSILPRLCELSPEFKGHESCPWVCQREAVFIRWRFCWELATAASKTVACKYSSLPIKANAAQKSFTAFTSLWISFFTLKLPGREGW